MQTELFFLYFSVNPKFNWHWCGLREVRPLPYVPAELPSPESSGEPMWICRMLHHYWNPTQISPFFQYYLASCRTLSHNAQFFFIWDSYHGKGQKWNLIFYFFCVLCETKHCQRHKSCIKSKPQFCSFLYPFSLTTSKLVSASSKSSIRISAAMIYVYVIYQELLH